jgi:regulator of sirC expression with transglutaminase-like and TPR domain
MDDGDIDVGLGAALIARDVFGNLDVPDLLRQFDALAAPLRSAYGPGEGLRSLTAANQAIRLADHIYGTLGFRGNEENYYDPKNSLLPDVLERRTGIPITLALVYCEIARRAGVPAHGVSFPGHFLVRIERNEALGESPGALLVDPFFSGRVLDEEALLKLLRRVTNASETLRPEFLAPATARSILVRMLVNLKGVHLARGDHARAHLALDRIVTLTPESASALKERGMIAAKLGAIESARADLARALEIDPSARDTKAIRTQLETLGSVRSKLN